MAAVIFLNKKGRPATSGFFFGALLGGELKGVNRFATSDNEHNYHAWGKTVPREAEARGTAGGRNSSNK
jgi:hypothetical protein